jgi:hypothetical protein
MAEKLNLRGSLGEFAGDWSGRNQLWMEPGTPVHECEIAACLVLVARGACAAIRYAWEEGGQPQEGLLVVRNAALGSYAAPEGPDWGWRIVIGSDGPDELHLLMYNIAPDGGVYPAVESRLLRRRA